MMLGHKVIETRLSNWSFALYGPSTSSSRGYLLKQTSAVRHGKVTWKIFVRSPRYASTWSL